MQHNTEPQMVTQKVNPNSLSPEEVYDILKNKSGRFMADWDDCVYITWDRPETDVEIQKRLADELVRYQRAEELRKKEALERADRTRIRNLFRTWRKTHPAYHEVNVLRRWSHQPGPRLPEHIERQRELEDLLYSERAFENFMKFMTA